jgi:hypothetical protein
MYNGMGREIAEGGLRRFSCTNCGTPLEAYPPDEEHRMATRTPDKYADSVKVEHRCGQCGHANIIYWGLVGATIKEKKLLHSKERMSNLWFVVAVLLGLVGGLWGFAHGYRKDPERAKAVLFTGGMTTIVLTVLLLLS